MNKKKIGTISEIPIYAKISESRDVIKDLSYEDLSLSLRKRFEKYLKERNTNRLDNWMAPKSFILSEKEYTTVCDMKNSIINNRSIANREFLSYLLSGFKKEMLKEICKKYSLRGYSKLSKEEIIEFIRDSLSGEEIRDFLYNNELDIISREFANALKIIKGKDSERIEKVDIREREGYEIEIRFAKDLKEQKIITIAYIYLTKENRKNPDRLCDCFIGRYEGFCRHFWVLFIKAYKEGFLNIEDWKLTALPLNFKNNIRLLNI
jgi:hypothetical protein